MESTKMYKIYLAYFVFSSWLPAYKHESDLDFLVTVSELCQYLRISTINSTP